MSVTPDPIHTSTFQTSDGLTLAYDVWQPNGNRKGVPVVLHHGFAATALTNWETPGIVQALIADNREVIALDARGHGRSDKPHEPAAYGHNRMSDDLSTLFDHLGHERVDLIGYSMGGYVAAITATRAEPRLRSVVVGGIGGKATTTASINRDAIAEGLSTDDPKTVTDRTARQFRYFADMTGSDRLALAAIMRAPFHVISGLDRIVVPTLVLVGQDDELATNPEVLSNAIPGATLQITPGNHMSAVAEPAYAKGIVDFFARIDKTSP